MPGTWVRVLVHLGPEACLTAQAFQAQLVVGGPTCRCRLVRYRFVSLCILEVLGIEELPPISRRRDTDPALRLVNKVVSKGSKKPRAQRGHRRRRVRAKACEEVIHEEGDEPEAAHEEEVRCSQSCLFIVCFALFYN